MLPLTAGKRIQQTALAGVTQVVGVDRKFKGLIPGRGNDVSLFLSFPLSPTLSLPCSLSLYQEVKWDYFQSFPNTQTERCKFTCSPIDLREPLGRPALGLAPWLLP